MSKRRLGKGIDALLGGPAEDTTAETTADTTVEGAPSGAAGGEGEPKEGIVTLPRERIRPNPDQPRKRFSQDTLEELAASIREKGVIQPIVVEAEKDGSYQIVAGERRYRAAGLAGLTELPVLIRTFTQSEKLEIALIENLQREDLNPIEEAQAFAGLIKEHGWTQEELAQRLGVSRTAIANSIRLLKLPEDISELVEEGTLSAGHARAVLSLHGEAAQRKLARKIEAEGLSVREAEALAKPRKTTPSAGDGGSNAGTGDAKEGTGSGADPKKDPRPVEIQQINDQLRDFLGTNVYVRGDNHRGQIQIDYYSMDDLERVLELIYEGTAPPELTL
ncbi:MAG: ParB/RepB/Spo0J family partition protein [Spirochaetota bacterium]